MKRKENIPGFVLLAASVGAASGISILIYDKLRSAGAEQWLLAICILLNIIVISLLFFLIDFLRRKITIEKPVRQILEATDEISHGNFNIELNPVYGFGRTSEFGRIMENINKMCKELSTNEIQKSDFIANFSHEVKTPIASMNNYLTLLSDDAIPEEERKEYMKCLKASLERLTTLTGDILKLSKLENGKLSKKPEMLHLDAVLTDVILSFENRMDDKNIDLDCDIQEISYVTDKLYFETIAGNLLSNAIKFSKEGGRVEVRLLEDEDFVHLSVKDYGCGMTEETGKHIFEKFYQGDTSHSKEGNGLGLAMVKKIIDIIGGTIKVSSEIGKGSTFTVSLKKEKNNE